MSTFYLPSDARFRAELLTGRIEALASVVISAMCSNDDAPPKHVAEVMWVVSDLAKELHDLVTATKSEVPA